jgi:hypothetical protein
VEEEGTHVERLVDVTDEVGDEHERAGHVAVVERAHGARGALVRELLCCGETHTRVSTNTSPRAPTHTSEGAVWA